MKTTVSTGAMRHPAEIIESDEGQRFTEFLRRMFIHGVLLGASDALAQAGLPKVNTYLDSQIRSEQGASHEVAALAESLRAHVEVADELAAAMEAEGR